LACLYIYFMKSSSYTIRTIKIAIATHSSLSQATFSLLLHVGLSSPRNWSLTMLVNALAIPFLVISLTTPGKLLIACPIHRAVSALPLLCAARDFGIYGIHMAHTSGNIVFLRPCFCKISALSSYENCTFLLRSIQKFLIQIQH